jgi:polar amino acid transport system substrate-binding protein
LKGFSIEIIQAVMDELGEKYPIMFLPGPRGEHVLATEQNVMSFSLFRTPEREDKYKWVGPISTQSVYFYKQKGNPKTYSTIDDIKGARLITVPHRGLVTDHVGALGITNVLKISSREKQFLLLFSGRAELLVNVSEFGIPYYLKQIDRPSDSLVKTQVKLLEFPLYIACSKDIPDEVIQRWQAALDRVKASPKYQEINTRYLHSH